MDYQELFEELQGMYGGQEPAGPNRPKNEPVSIKHTYTMDQLSIQRV